METSILFAEDYALMEEAMTAQERAEDIRCRVVRHMEEYAEEKFRSAIEAISDLPSGLVSTREVVEILERVQRETRQNVVIAV